MSCNILSLDVSIRQNLNFPLHTENTLIIGIIFQACRNGLVQHLEHLLYYGADMNARNASGNTPLHVCAVNGQESCARVLLFRGAQHDSLNFANQTPYQVAVIAGNLDLADVIQGHRPENVGESVFNCFLFGVCISSRRVLIA